MSQLRGACIVAVAVFGLLVMAVPVQAIGEVGTRLAIRPIDPVVVGADIRVVVDLRLASGAPLANEAVTLTNNGVLVRRSRTKADGSTTFRLPTDLDPGEYRLVATYGGLRNAYFSSSDEFVLVVTPYELAIETVPSLPGMVFALDGQRFTADEGGIARITVQVGGEHRLSVLDDQYQTPDKRASFSRWSSEIFGPQIVIKVPLGAPLQAGFDTQFQAEQVFVDLDGVEIDPSRVSSIVVRSSLGNSLDLADGRARWYQASRAVRRPNGLESVSVRYSVESVEVDGSNVVNAGQQRFYLFGRDRWEIELLLYSATVSTSDALFGFNAGGSVDVTYPSGKVVRVDPDPNGELTIRWLARGIYRMSVADAPGWSPAVPVALSRNQEVSLRVISYLDMVIAILVVLGLAFGLLHVGRPHLIPTTAAVTGRAVRSVSASSSSKLRIWVQAVSTAVRNQVREVSKAVRDRRSAAGQADQSVAVPERTEQATPPKSIQRLAAVPKARPNGAGKASAAAPADLAPKRKARPSPVARARPRSGGGAA